MPVTDQVACTAWNFEVRSVGRHSSGQVAYQQHQLIRLPSLRQQTPADPRHRCGRRHSFAWVLLTDCLFGGAESGRAASSRSESGYEASAGRAEHCLCRGCARRAAKRRARLMRRRRPRRRHPRRRSALTSLLRLTLSAPTPTRGVPGLLPTCAPPSGFQAQRFTSRPLPRRRSVTRRVPHASACRNDHETSCAHPSQGVHPKYTAPCQDALTT